jgi:drug/metabolite transporter (DMT)-like permease
MRGHLAMLCFAVLVAGSFSLGRLAAPHIDAAALNAVRFVIAALILVVAARGLGQYRARDFRAPWRYFLLAIPYALYFVTMFEGLKLADPVSLSAVFTTNPALSALAGYVILSQVTTKRMALAIAIGGIGALWVIFGGNLSAALAFDIGPGEMIYFVGCIGHALMVPLFRLLNRGESALVFNSGVIGVGAVLLLIWSAPQMLATDWGALPGIVWTTIAYTAVFATALSLVLIRTASLYLPAAKVMAYTYLVPTFVIGWQLVMGQGAPQAAVLPGIGLTILALVMLLKNEESLD